MIPPLGATLVPGGAAFAIYSEHATAVELCLLSESGAETRVPLTSRTHNVWHGEVPGVAEGTRYAYRVSGPTAPGLRFDPTQRLLCPYARAVEMLDGTPVGVITATPFDWAGDAPPAIARTDLVIYEAHVRGLTLTHPDVPAELRGTYGGLASAPMLAHFKALGINAIELLPVHRSFNETFLQKRGLSNYWGYSTIGFFAPEARYRAGTTRACEITEFKTMVRTLHAAGIEVLLDVVYNHTGEGDHLGPLLSFRGIDNPTYYRLRPEDPSRYVDDTGCGNTLNVQHPQTLKLVMDSLRYWVSEMHVDGFRFDLATTLARGTHGVRDFEAHGTFLQAVHQDPMLARVKLIAEPWDTGPGGYQVGQFPAPWAEWNDRYRDALRAFWAGHPSSAAEMGARLTGSRDLFPTRGPPASINFVTAHDGFTLRDLVSYETKHNAANGENNRDGTDNNLAWNCGVEGTTGDAVVNALRLRQQKNFLTSLLLSRGTPMLTAGDEFGRTQNGNNNAYCQDNALSWCDWQWSAEHRSLFELTCALLTLRRTHAIFRDAEFPASTHVVWRRHDGVEMTAEDWHNPQTQSLGMLLGDEFFVLLNASPIGLRFALPSGPWHILIDTFAPPAGLVQGTETLCETHAAQVLRRVPESSNTAESSVA